MVLCRRREPNIFAENIMFGKAVAIHRYCGSVIIFEGL
jgi:hypothetical protein